MDLESISLSLPASPRSRSSWKTIEFGPCPGHAFCVRGAELELGVRCSTKGTPLPSLRKPAEECTQKIKNVLL